MLFKPIEKHSKAKSEQFWIQLSALNKQSLMPLTQIMEQVLGSRGGAVVRTLAPHQFGSGSNPEPGVISGLSLLLVLVLAPRVFLRVFRFFFPSTKINISKLQFDQSGVRGPRVCQS